MRQLCTLALAVALMAASCAVSEEAVKSERLIVEPSAAATAAQATAPAPGTDPVFQPTPTELSQPTTGPTITPAPTATPRPTGVCGVGPLALPNPDRPRYAASVTVDPTSGSVTGDWSVEFTPDLPIDQIVVRLWPNGPRPASGGSEMSIADVRVDGAPSELELATATLGSVDLGRTLAPGDTVRIDATFELSVPSELNSRISRRDDYMRLGTFLPLLSWEPGIGWATEPATALFAEAVSSPVADYAVAVTVPEGYDVLASGVEDDEGVWRVEAARDFALSVGRFRTVTAVANAPEPVQVIVGVHETLDDDPDTYLAYVIDSLESYSRRWGPYPWPSLTFALTPNLGGGIEFPTHIMQGPQTIGRTTSHEVGHMFFYSLVGNNQGTAPWLDEGLTSYAEFTYEGTQPGAYTIPEAGVGEATQPMTYWDSRADIYYRSVYSQTGFALQRLGTQEEVDCALARYVATNAYQIATADDFVAAFEPAFPGVVDLMAALGVVVESN